MLKLAILTVLVDLPQIAPSSFEAYKEDFIIAIIILFLSTGAGIIGYQLAHNARTDKSIIRIDARISEVNEKLSNTISTALLEFTNAVNILSQQNEDQSKLCTVHHAQMKEVSSRIVEIRGFLDSKMISENDYLREKLKNLRANKQNE